MDAGLKARLDRIIDRQSGDDVWEDLLALHAAVEAALEDVDSRHDRAPVRLTDDDWDQGWASGYRFAMRLVGITITDALGAA